MSVTIQIRRGTAAAWTAANPVLALGERGIESDTLKEKSGDGSTVWASLAYLPFGNVLSTRAINTTAPLAGGGDLSADRTLTISGVPVIKASADLTGQTAAVASVCTYTPGANGTFRVGVYLTVTAISVDVVQLSCTYTDETSTSRTQIFTTLAGASSVSTTGAFVFPTMDIRAKSGSAITVVAALTTSIGSITFDVGAQIDLLR